MLKKFARVIVGVIAATALAVGVSAAPALVAPSLVAPAAAASYVSTKYSSPKYGERSKDVTALQQRLVKAKVLAKKYVTGYYGPLTKKAVKKFQKKVDLKATGKVTKATWKKLVAKTGKIKISKAKKSSKKIDRRCKKGEVLCIDKTRDKVYYMKSGKIIKTMDARFGCANSRTREGRFSVLRKKKHVISNLYGSPMPYSIFFSGGQAVHYSSDFKARGYNGCSHGCVNIRDKKTLAWVYKRIDVGDPVIVYRS
ncbi:peptidoglycan-binding protein [Microlunatus sp. GCM10028923]|uniref:L,D-transpeptidase family protein n=1 Tax=Microlunatus sp. GCM10028923 TaxID=3273400 RepID=UPI00360F6B41